MISFWKDKNGALRSSVQGLNEKQVEFLRELQPGDNLVVFFNENKKGPSYPDADLVKAKKKQ